MADRAVLFVDGNNWYHAIRRLGVPDLGRLDYARISLKLCGPRSWLGTRYYIGRVPRSGDEHLYGDQRRFLASLRQADPRVSTHLGRLEERPVDNPAARELRTYLANLHIQIDRRVFHDLVEIARRHRRARALVEKAVDVKLAVDLVVLAERDRFDAAYLLSADGDFTPAVEAVRQVGKKVYAVSPNPGARLAAIVNSYIRLDRDWFADCYR